MNYDLKGHYFQLVIGIYTWSFTWQLV